MEISGEIHYANVDIDFDVDYLAETLATNHDFVDTVVMHTYVDEHMDGAIEQIDNVALDVDELREKIRELEPNNNYVRINDLHKIIEEVVRAEICVAFAAGHHKMQDRLNGTDIGIKEG
tara:strand:+ start:221 stop:577 length:357 start_codon:yes stop_codon:yes gene_type:complete